ncbi:unnamed protein product [Acanthoscelides obtectus]|uniref:Uncharacterized protein n=1 Tax=Acanthoscelides obtectus TaxID=200917 RepID=A0A9P0M8G4_ACAOB|nr:unnamed protein product [Acanthoscelides obtectus]CAK1624255.1 hypothetical protein AOBTE_LOCUS2444 [Acanthoscelides obtectus]
MKLLVRNGCGDHHPPYKQQVRTRNKYRISTTIIWELDKRRRRSKLHFSTRGCSFWHQCYPKRRVKKMPLRLG